MISFSFFSAVMSFGGHLGKLQYGPPTDFSSLVEAAEPGRDVKLQPFLTLGTCTDLIVSGPSSTADHLVFVPAPINTAKVSGRERKEGGGEEGGRETTAPVKDATGI